MHELPATGVFEQDVHLKRRRRRALKRSEHGGAAAWERSELAWQQTPADCLIRHRSRRPKAQEGRPGAMRRTYRTVEQTRSPARRKRVSEMTGLHTLLVGTWVEQKSPSGGNTGRTTCVGARSRWEAQETEKAGRTTEEQFLHWIVENEQKLGRWMDEMRKPRDLTKQQNDVAPGQRPRAHCHDSSCVLFSLVPGERDCSGHVVVSAPPTKITSNNRSSNWLHYLKASAGLY